MRSKLMVATAVAALSVGIAAAGFAASSKPLSAKDAKEFVAKAEAELAGQSEYLNRAGWIQATYINYDSNWLVAKATAENTSVSMRYAKEAARFDQVKVDPDTRRKLDILKRQLVLPASSRPGESRTSLSQAALLRAHETERQIRRQRSTGNRPYPGRYYRQYVGSDLGQHLRYCRAERCDAPL